MAMKLSTNLRQKSINALDSVTRRLKSRSKPMSVISVVIGSVRDGRFSEKPAKWIAARLSKREGVEARLLDLGAFPMPFFDQAVAPSAPGRGAHEHPVVQRWTRAIGESDGFVFVAPEYNHGPAAVLKNALDWVYALFEGLQRLGLFRVAPQAGCFRKLWRQRRR